MQPLLYSGRLSVTSTYTPTTKQRALSLVQPGALANTFRLRGERHADGRPALPLAEHALLAPLTDESESSERNGQSAGTDGTPSNEQSEQGRASLDRE